MRFVSPAFALLLVAGCSPSESFAPQPATLVVHPVADRADIRFAPPTLRDGERLTVQTGDIQMESLATGGRHHVTATANRGPRRVVGLLDGRERLAVDLAGTPGTTGGGETAQIPTSVHRLRVCLPTGECTTSVEYDYDLHDPSGEGTTVWSAPDDRSATIDRLRFEFDSEDGVADARVRVSAPQALAVAR